METFGQKIFWIFRQLCVINTLVGRRTEMNDDTKYEQICNNIRFTDEISFKLLGLVPLISGSAIVVILLKGETVWSPAIYFLSLFGALVTLGLFRWELRNIRTCNYLRACASDLDGLDRSTENPAPGLSGLFGDKLPIGKTEAEKFIYGVTVISWLALPSAALSVART
jgi:hypothetical protein